MLEYKNKHIYFGDLHCHTGFSDGQLTPYEAFQHAKQEGNLDFMAITDHAASITEEKFKATQQAAIECTTNNFVAIAGCENGFDDSYENEYGVPVINGGELIVFQSNTWCSSCDSLETFTDILQNNGIAIAGFAHPQEASWPTEKIWNGYDMAHHRCAKVQSFVRMIEVCNETSDYNLIHEKLYPTALDCGFRVSAIAVSDTHQANWGCKALRARTAVYADTLNLESIIEALRSQHCYATETGNTILDFSINGVDMGGDIPDTTTYEVCVSILETDKHPDCQISYIEIISDYGNSVYKKDVSAHEAHLDTMIESNTARYFYIRAVNKKGERIWSSPIWTGRSFDTTAKETPLQKLDKTLLKVASPDSPATIRNLMNGDPNQPWCCTKQNSCAIIDLGDVHKVAAIGYHRHTIPYNDLFEVKALLNRYCYSFSMDGINYMTSYHGIITNYGSEQIHRFPNISTRYIKIDAISSVGSDAGDTNSFPKIGELTLYAPIS